MKLYFESNEVNSIWWELLQIFTFPVSYFEKDKGQEYVIKLYRTIHGNIAGLHVHLWVNTREMPWMPYFPWQSVIVAIIFMATCHRYHTFHRGHVNLPLMPYFPWKSWQFAIDAMISILLWFNGNDGNTEYTIPVTLFFDAMEFMKTRKKLVSILHPFHGNNFAMEIPWNAMKILGTGWQGRD